MITIRLTMAQALVRVLLAQRSEIGGNECSLFAGIFAIFGHGNVAGMAELEAALAEARSAIPEVSNRAEVKASRAGYDAVRARQR